jgi:hypothetical protein
VLAGRVRAMLLGAPPAHAPARPARARLHRLDRVRTLYDLHFDAAVADCALVVSNPPLQTRG